MGESTKDDKEGLDDKASSFGVEKNFDVKFDGEGLGFYGDKSKRLSESENLNGSKDFGDYDKGVEEKIIKNELEGERARIKNDEISSNEVGREFELKGLSARSLWGGLVNKLKSRNFITLYTACGEIRDVRFDNNKLIVNVKEDFLFNILTREDNKSELSRMVKEVNGLVELEFVKMTDKTDYSKENFDRLKDLFGNDLKIK